MPSKHWSVFVITFFLVWMGFVGSAFAQGMDDPSGSASATVASSGAGDTGAMSLNMISAVIDRTIGQDLLLKFKDKALSIAAALTPAALVIAGALALATLLWQVLIAMINKESPLTAATEAVLFAMVTAALLQMFPVILNDIIGLGNYIAGSISGGGTAGGALGKAAHDFIAAFLAKFVDVVVKSIQNMGTGVLDFFSAPMDMVASLFFLVVACYFAFGALLELVGVVLVGPVVIGIAVALSPLFIATLASHWTRRWFDQWFNFLINGAMLTAMVVLVLTLLTGVVAATIGTTATSFQVGEALGLALLAAGMGKIFAAIPSFADALLPGRTSAGAALNSGKSSAPPTPGGKSGNSVTSAAANAAGSAGTAATAAASATPAGALATLVAKAAQISAGGTGSRGVAGMTARAAAMAGPGVKNAAVTGAQASMNAARQVKDVIQGASSASGKGLGGFGPTP